MPEKNNRELTAKEYDKIFAKKHKKPKRKRNNRIKIYQKAVKFLDKDKSIIELGCGSGILTEFIGDLNYIGIDFSKVQIYAARKKYPHRSFDFLLGDIKNWIFQSNRYNYVCLEVLEHIKDDLSIIKKIPKGSNFVFSVPSLSSTPAHVRYFESFNEIEKRYGKYLTFENKDKLITTQGNVIRIVKSRIK
jgi:2-polyprenyl-3-methyl-5-hydroxy-6-metoxy-1,4-benzoquinol methylase